MFCNFVPTTGPCFSESRAFNMADVSWCGDRFDSYLLNFCNCQVLSYTECLSINSNTLNLKDMQCYSVYLCYTVANIDESPVIFARANFSSFRWLFARFPALAQMRKLLAEVLSQTSKSCTIRFHGTYFGMNFDNSPHDFPNFSKMPPVKTCALSDCAHTLHVAIERNNFRPQWIIDMVVSASHEC